jgi:carbon monoxide dehydrogenase subunit G
MLQTYTFTVQQPIHVVWEALIDPDLTEKWLTGLQKIEHLEGARGQVNSKSTYQYLRAGRKSEAVETVLQRKDFEAFRTGFDHPLFHMLMGYTLVQEGESTAVTFDYDLKVKNFWLRLFFPLLKRSIRREVEGDHQRFRQLVEAKE